MSNDDEIERLGLLVDKCENFVAAGKIPGMRDRLKLQALEESMLEIRDEVKEIFFALGGDKDTWND